MIPEANLRFKKSVVCCLFKISVSRSVSTLDVSPRRLPLVGRIVSPYLVFSANCRVNQVEVVGINSFTSVVLRLNPFPNL